MTCQICGEESPDVPQTPTDRFCCKCGNPLGEVVYRLEIRELLFVTIKVPPTKNIPEEIWNVVMKDGTKISNSLRQIV